MVVTAKAALCVVTIVSTFYVFRYAMLSQTLRDEINQKGTFHWSYYLHYCTYTVPVQDLKVISYQDKYSFSENMATDWLGQKQQEEGGSNHSACDYGRVDLSPIRGTRDYDGGQQEDKVFFLGKTSRSTQYCIMRIYECITIRNIWPFCFESTPGVFSGVSGKGFTTKDSYCHDSESLCGPVWSHNL